VGSNSGYEFLGNFYFSLQDSKKSEEPVVGVSVVAYGMPFLRNPLKDMGISLHVLTADEECSLDIIAFEDFQYLGRIDVIGTIIESQVNTGQIFTFSRGGVSSNGFPSLIPV